MAETKYMEKRECPVWVIIFGSVNKEFVFSVDDGEGFSQFKESEVEVTDRRLDGFEFYPRSDGRSLLIFAPLIENNLLDRIQEFESGAYQEFREKLARIGHPYI